jgi:hypothetical protein
MRYIEDPALPIDNNHDERQIRPWATGRNYAKSRIMQSKSLRAATVAPAMGVSA